MDELFDKLFAQLQFLRQHEATLPADHNESRFSRLDMAAYHLATCRSLVKSALKTSARRPVRKNGHADNGGVSRGRTACQSAA